MKYADRMKETITQTVQACMVQAIAMLERLGGADDLVGPLTVTYAKITDPLATKLFARYAQTLHDPSSAWLHDPAVADTDNAKLALYALSLCVSEDTFNALSEHMLLATEQKLKEETDARRDHEGGGEATEAPGDGATGVADDTVSTASTGPVAAQTDAASN